jgi:hypothetical protein
MMHRKSSHHGRRGTMSRRTAMSWKGVMSRRPPFSLRFQTSSKPGSLCHNKPLLMQVPYWNRPLLVYDS